MTIASEWHWLPAARPSPQHAVYDQLVWHGMILGAIEAFRETGPFYGNIGTGRAPLDYRYRTGPADDLDACRKRVEANVLRALNEGTQCIAVAGPDDRQVITDKVRMFIGSEIERAPGGGIKYRSERLQALVNAVLSIGPSGREKIKLLEWEELVRGQSFCASSIGLRYYVYHAHDDGLWHAYTEGFQPTEFRPTTSTDAAKAAAQADYEFRIRSALVEVPAVKGEPEPVAWQRRAQFPSAPGAAPQWEPCSRDEATGHFERQSGYEYRALYTAQPADAGMREALADLLAYIERNECTHESISRGGSIWTICDDCGRKWADDRGGFKPYVEPAEITAARAALTAPGATTKSDGGDQPLCVGLDWQLSDNAKARLAEIDAAIVRPGDPRLNQIIGGPSDPSSTRSDVTWQSINSAPKDGTPIDIRAVSTFRFQPYKPNSDQRRKGILGRWQTVTEYGGWNNCSEPQGEWRPNDGKVYTAGV